MNDSPFSPGAVVCLAASGGSIVTFWVDSFDLFKSSVDTCVVDWNILNVEISTAESCCIHLPPSAILFYFFCIFCFKKITDVWDVIVLRCERTRGVNLRSDADALASGVWVNCVACSHFRMAPTGERKGM